MLPNIFQETNFLAKGKVTDTLIDANSGISVNPCEKEHTTCDRCHIRS